MSYDDGPVMSVLWPSVCNNLTFWDNDLSWNTSDPEISECFQKSVLVWIPCVIFWLFLPCELYFICHHSRGRFIPTSLLNVTKLVLNGTLIIVIIFDLGFSHRSWSSNSQPSLNGSLYLNLFSPVLQLVTIVGLIYLIVYERMKGVRSSPLLFFYWLSRLICDALTMYSLTRRDYNQLSWSNMDRLEYLLFTAVTYTIVIVQFILSCPNDSPPLHLNLEDDDQQNACPRNTASFLSKVFFLWFDKMLWMGYSNHPLVASDVWKSTPETQTCHAFPEFNKAWTSRVKSGKKPSLLKVLGSMQFGTYLFVTLLKIIEYALAYSNPVLLNWLIEFVSKNEPYWHGYVYITGLLLVASMASIVGWQTAYFGCVMEVSIQSALFSAIYRKSLTLSGSSRRHLTTGEIVNLIAVDSLNVAEFFFRLVDGVTLPFQIAVGIVMLYNLLGNATFAGLAAMVLMKAVSFIIAKQMERFQLKQLDLKDQRVKHVNEAVIGVKVLKLFAWEIPFMNRIRDIRSKETVALQYGMYLESGSMVLWIIAPAVVTLVTLVTYVLMDETHVLDAAKIFVTLSIIQLLGASFIRLPMVIVSFVKAMVSARRLDLFLNSNDLDPDSVSHDLNSEYAIHIERGSFTWSAAAADDAKGFTLLRDINMSVGYGSLVAVVGPVGCGKSSLIAAILGEMEKILGTVNTKGRIGYVPQQAWIQNETLKGNILFGRKENVEFYKKVIEACALIPDFELLPGGDSTEVGENGINLSGGQKQRISLARAVYNDADIYLLDDPLSAVDSHVGQHIFEHVIGPTGLLKDKTRVLVTHGLAYLPYVDKIVVINEGSITEIGSYKDLMEIKGDFADFITTYGTANDNEPSTTVIHQIKVIDGFNVNSKSVSISGAGRLTTTTTTTETESMEIGQVNSSIYKLYIEYVGYEFASLVVLLLISAYAFSAGAQNWLSLWSSDPLEPDGSQNVQLRDLRLEIYGALILLFGVFLVLATAVLTHGARRASNRFHSGMLDSVLHSPMAFFDTTPSGRIVNRFSEDIQSVDAQVPLNFRDLLTAFMEIFTAVVVICIRLPILLAFIVPMAIIYYMFQRFFVRTINQLRRLESVAKSPVYSRFSETIGGVATIRAFNLQADFINQFDDRVDEVIKFQYYRRTMFRWFGIRLDSMGGLLTFFTGLFAIMSRDTMTPGTIALVVSYSMSVFWIFSWLVISAGELESSVVSVERIHEYIQLPNEADWDIPERRPGNQWPSRGSVTFRNYSTKYRKELQPVLQSLTCSINAGEKIGVVGRTGAGKSSITMSLFRIIEAVEGSIFIDGVNISTIGLHDLRSRLTIIPQDPVLFAGTLRLNLDPFECHTDDDIWKALDMAHLKDFVQTLVCGLMHHIAEGGVNLSVGQKQLVCLARALLRKTKILVLDEATAAVDLETDDLIQATIRKEFADCTVLTIAHRLNTIMDSSRVMVLDKGRVIEYDTPDNLLDDERSTFYAMAKQTGLVN